MSFFLPKLSWFVGVLFGREKIAATTAIILAHVVFVWGMLMLAFWWAG